ncbi:MAG: hypothetical protein AAF235_06280 [Planctomycetota bacterium]
MGSTAPDPGLPSRLPPEAQAKPQEQGPFRRDLLYPDRYAWYVLVGALDIMLTATVIRYFSARELNTVADFMLDRFGLSGLIALKFATIIVVVLICDYIGRRKFKQGLRLSEWAIALSAVPVVISMIQIAMVSSGWLPIGETGAEHNQPGKQRETRPEAVGAVPEGTAVPGLWGPLWIPDVASHDELGPARNPAPNPAPRPVSNAARSEQRLEPLTEDEVVLGVVDARHVLIEMAEQQVDTPDPAERTR